MKLILVALPALLVAMNATAGNRISQSSSNAGAIQPDVLYHNYCSVCHGDKGDGKSRARNSFANPPRDFTAPGAAQQMPRELMIAVTRDGKPGTAMVGWKTQLNKAEIEAVVDFVRGSFMQQGDAYAVRGPGTGGMISGTSAHGGRERDAQPVQAKAAPPTPPVKVDMSLPVPNKLAGNAQRGRKFYDANCATCHGVKGDGQGPRAYFIRPVPRNFIEPAERGTLNRPAIFAATAYGSLGAEMPAWNKVIDDQTIADVTEYVFRAFIQPGDAVKVAGSKSK